MKNHSKSLEKDDEFNAKLKIASERLRALAHPVRMKILEHIDEHHTIKVDKIYRNLNTEQGITSQHLRILRLANLITLNREERDIIYQVNYEAVYKLNYEVTKFLENYMV